MWQILVALFKKIQCELPTIKDNYRQITAELPATTHKLPAITDKSLSNYRRITAELPTNYGHYRPLPTITDISQTMEKECAVIRPPGIQATCAANVNSLQNDQSVDRLVGRSIDQPISRSKGQSRRPN